jgi:hypothetical protein
MYDHVGMWCRALPLLLAPSLAMAEGPPRRISVGLEVTDYFALDYAITPHATARDPQPHLGIVEIDVPVRLQVTPWLRAAALLGFTDLSLGFEETFPSPSLAHVDENALVIGAGAQAFYRAGRWEVHGGAWLRTPIALGDANATFFGGPAESRSLGGGQSVAVTIGAACRLGPTSLSFDLGYTHSLRNFEANGLGVDQSFRGPFLTVGLALW